jgi:hypothetical protein
MIVFPNPKSSVPLCMVWTQSTKNSPFPTSTTPWIELLTGLQEVKGRDISFEVLGHRDWDIAPLVLTVKSDSMAATRLAGS